MSIEAGATLREAAKLMREPHVGAPVVTFSHREHPLAVGLITDRDLAIKVLAHNLDPGDLRISITEAVVMADAGALPWSRSHISGPPPFTGL